MPYIMHYQAHLGLDDQRRAASTAKEAVTVARHRGARVDECGALLALARVTLAGKRSRHHSAAAKPLEEASRIITETGAATFEPFVLIARAELARLTDDEEAAVRDLRKAARLLRAMGAPGRARRLKQKQG